MTMPVDRNTLPRLPVLLSEFAARLNNSFMKALGKSIPDLVERYGSSYEHDFEQHLELLRKAFPERPWPDWAVQGYVSLNKAILVEEMSFKRSGEYSAKPEELERVIEDVYNNADVMDRYYLVGLYCTYFLWPHHYRILEFFRQSFLRVGRPPGHLMEWGVGHGLLALEALRQWRDPTMTLIDLSQYSLAFAERLLAADGQRARCEILQGDVVEMTNAPRADRIICSELLEHVPDPDRLLGRIHDALLPGGIAYLTGAINAAQPDHIFLFNTDEQLLDMVRQHGFEIRAQMTACHPNRASEQNPPSVLALVVQRST